MPNLIPDWLPWMRPAGRLIWSSRLLRHRPGDRLRTSCKRPKPDRPATWAECIAGAVGVFALMTLAYAVIPHEWITFSDKYLQWDTTKFVFRSSQDIFVPPRRTGRSPSTSRRSATSSSPASTCVFFGLNLVLFVDVAEARRSEKPAAADADAARRSRFGRPLRRARPTPSPVTAGAGERW